MAKKNFTDIQVETLPELAGYAAYSNKANPEEDALQKIFNFIQKNNLLSHSKSMRLFGRNTYPTEKPNPHGYEVFLAVSTENLSDIPVSEEIKKKKNTSGKYAVLNDITLTNIVKGWKTVWKWVDQNKLKRAQEKKEDHGYVLGFEEMKGWAVDNNPMKWSITLWAPIDG